jgi:hypothetical protein
MSNVRRLTPPCSKASANASSCFASRVSGKLCSPSLWPEPDPTSNTTHALAVPGYQIERLLKASIGRVEARCSTPKVGSGCPSRFAGGQRTVVVARKNKASGHIALEIMYASSQSKAWRANASKNSSHSKASLPGARLRQHSAYGRFSCRARNAARVPAAA